MTRPKSDDAWKNAVLDDLSKASDSTFLIETPDKFTGSANRFYVDLHKTLRVLILLTEAVIFADNAALVSKKIIDGAVELPNNFDPFVSIGDESGPFKKRLSYVHEALLQMIVVRVVDNFTSYLSDVIRECLKAKPQLLRSKETVTLESILQYQSIEEIHEALVDRKIDELAYLGFSRLSEWIEERLGVSELQSFPPATTLVEILEVRNCIVHNRAAMSSKFIRNVGKQIPNATAGAPIEIDLKLIYIASRATADYVSVLDRKLADKFKLECRPSNKTKMGKKQSEG
jgi:hypothetical protein